MKSLPALSSRKVVQALKSAGFVESRQKGSHLILIHSVRIARTVVPIHSGKTIKKPLLKAIIEDAKLSIKEFIDLL